MEASPDSRYANQRFSKTAKAVASAVVFAACLLSLVLAGRSKGYQSQALLSYSAPTSISAEGVIPATVAANRVLDDAHLLVILNSYDLYAQLRQRSPEQAVIAHMRSLMTIEEPNPASLRVSFLDQDERKSRSVTNDLAAILAAYRIAEPARPISPSTPAANPMPVPASAVPAPGRSAAPVAAQSPATEVRLRRRLALVTAQLSALREEQAGLSARPGAKTNVEPVREDAHPLSDEPRYSPPTVQLPDSHSADRAALEGRLAFEQSHLVALLARYTEEYPEVIATRGTITELESSLASLPAAGPLPAPRTGARSVAGERANPVVPGGRQSAIAGADESAGSGRLERNQRRVAALERERDALTAKLASASPGLARPGNAPTPDQAIVSQAAPVVTDATTQEAGMVLPATSNAPSNTDLLTAPPTLFEPFQIEQRALKSVSVRMYPPRTFAWIAMGTALLLLLILLPGFLRPAAAKSDSMEYGRFLEVGMEDVQMYRPEDSEEMESAGEGISDPVEPRSAYTPMAYQAAASSSGDDSRDPYSPEDFAAQAVEHYALPAQAMSRERTASESPHPGATGAANGESNRAGNLDSRIARAVAKHYGS